tara:strand:- start:67 stop:1488 length:1422 start_codon:yes stop_codon:yes gene_type:complete
MSEAATYLGQKGYTIKKEYMDVEEQMQLREDLMMKPYVPKSSLAKPSLFPAYRESKKKFYIPRFYGKENYGKAEEIRLSDGEKINLKFKGELREHQKPIVEKFLKHIKKEKSGLLELHTGFGKTCLALYILAELGVKTLIIVHKEFLLRQWIERIDQFLPGAKIGKIQASKIEVEGNDIVIGMLQSLSMKDYDRKIFSDFGFTIIDECHHIGAEVFSKALFKIVTKYGLGLSATMKRKDGLTKVIKMFMGKVVCKKERKGEDNVVVKVMNYNVIDEEFNKIETTYRGDINYSRMIKKLCEFNPRREYILNIIQKEIKKDIIDQQIMVLGHNKSLLTYLHDAIKHRGIATVGYYIGGMKETELKISEGKKIIIATYAMAEEGLDIKTLTTLIMATPKVDVTQAVGRILRQKRKESKVIDIVDSHIVFQRHFKKRKRFYNKQNFKILNDMDIETKKMNKNETGFLKGICFIDNKD